MIGTRICGRCEPYPISTAAYYSLRDVSYGSLLTKLCDVWMPIDGAITALENKFIDGDGYGISLSIYHSFSISLMLCSAPLLFWEVRIGMGCIFLFLTPSNPDGHLTILFNLPKPAMGHFSLAEKFAWMGTLLGI